MTLEVRYEGKIAYKIEFKNDFESLYQNMAPFMSGKEKICIVSDSNVSKLYLEEIKKQFKNTDIKIYDFIFTAGEKQKNLDTVACLYEKLIKEEFDRNDILIALGGGVVGDLCGYAAATYLRGIRFVQVPTTLLSQVDSSIGGKTGVDFNTYKNMVGAFYMPILVYINISSLKTLSAKEFASGMAEVIKHGLIKDKKYFEYIMDNEEQIKSFNLEICKELVYKSACIKKEVVENDFKENGERALLNFGHTLGHAIEKEQNFKLSHGACVSLGMLCAMQISVLKQENEADIVHAKERYVKVKQVLDCFGLPVYLDNFDVKKVLEYTKNDKKMDAGRIKFILLKEIGEAYIDKSISDTDMEKALKMLIKQ